MTGQRRNPQRRNPQPRNGQAAVRRLSRRHWLYGTGGALIGLPLLESFGAYAQQSTGPKRLLLFFNPNGTITDEFWPTAGGTERDFTFGTILAPLEAHRDKLLILKGIDLAVTSEGPGGPHQRGMGALFTGQMLQEGTFVGGDGSLAGWADGKSVDQEIAATVGADTFLPSLELGVRATEAEVRTRLIYAGPAQPLPPMNNPQQVFDRLFAGLSGDPTELELVRNKRLSILDAVQEQFGQLSPELSTSDREKLDRHLEMVRGVERRMSLLGENTGSCAVPLRPPELGEEDENDMPVISQLQMDLLTLAVACDYTRVGSLQFSTAINAIRFPWLDSLGAGHTLSHAGPSDESARAQLILRGTWYSEQFAYLLSALSNIEEGDGTALDNSVVVWGNEISIGNVHSLETMPFVLAGGAGGVFDTGRLVNYEKESHNNLLVSLLNAFGIEAETFGHPDFATGPLSGLTA